MILSRKKFHKDLIVSFPKTDDFLFACPIINLFYGRYAQI